MTRWFLNPAVRSLGTWLLLAAGLAWCSGCGQATGQVSGTVTFKQKPVPGTELKFEKADNPSEQFFGVGSDDGTYQVSYRTLNGLPVGRYKVTITHYTLRGGQPLPPGEKGAALKSGGKVFKTAYSFEKDVTSGQNTIDFELTTGKKMVIPLDPEE